MACIEIEELVFNLNEMIHDISITFILTDNFFGFVYYAILISFNKFYEEHFNNSSLYE